MQRIHNTTPTRLSNTTIFFLFAAPIIVLSYMIYVFNPQHAGHWILYAMQVVADAISITVVLSLWLTILLDVITPQHHRPIHVIEDLAKFKKQPTIDIFIPVAGEPLEVITKTVQAAINMDYPHKTFVLDDARSKDVQKTVEKLGAIYITRDKRSFAKSGNINNGLKESTSEFFAIFDADQVPKKDFIIKLLPFMADPKVAMVQTPQYFANTHEFIAAGTSEAQEIFYKYICPAKNISNSVFCVGTNVVFRRTAIDEIGGIILTTHSEDIWTSRHLHEKGWHTIFVNEVLAVGTAPSNIISYFKQQLRWSKGGLSMLFLQNTLFEEKLQLDQRIQYFFSNIFYLVGFSILCYLVFPIIYLLFGVSGIRAESELTWILHYVPFFLLYYSLTWLLNGKLSLAPQATAMASFYPYLLAFFSTVFGTKYEWAATTAEKTKSDLIMKWIWPHIFLILITIFSFVIGWYEPENVWVTIIFTIWAAWNMYLLITFLNAENKTSVINDSINL